MKASHGLRPDLVDESPRQLGKIRGQSRRRSRRVCGESKVRHRKLLDSHTCKIISDRARSKLSIM